MQKSGKLSNVIQEIHNEVKGIYGYRRMTKK